MIILTIVGWPINKVSNLSYNQSDVTFTSVLTALQTV